MCLTADRLERRRDEQFGRLSLTGPVQLTGKEGPSFSGAIDNKDANCSGGNFMEMISKLAEGFIALFQAGGVTFSGWVSGIIPTVVCLMTAVNSVIKIIGTERVEAFAAKTTRNPILRYTVLPILAVFFVGNPMCYTFGRFVDEKFKPAYYDACVSFLHPVTGLFPHANPGELFVYTGIAAGLQQAGYATTGLALRYFVVGIIVILIRGILTERIYLGMIGNAAKKEA